MTPEREAAEHDRVWAEAQRLRLARDDSHIYELRPDYRGMTEKHLLRRKKARAVVAEPDDEDDRDLIDWFADEFPLDGGPGVCDWKYAPRVRTLWWMLAGGERKIVDGCDRV